MNRRPLCQAALLTTLGIALYGRPFWQVCTAVLACVVFTILELELSWKSLGIPPDSRKVKVLVLPLLLIPFWLFAGWQRMQKAAVRLVPAEEEEHAVISGVVYDRQNKEDKTILYLKDVILVSTQNNQQVFENQPDYRGTCIAYYKGNADCSIGNTIQVKGSLSPFEESKNPGQFDAKSYYRSQGIDFSLFQIEILGNDQQEDWLRQTLYQVKEFLHQKLEQLSGKHAPILQAMLLGEKSQMDSEIKELYQKNGISHVLVISGLHFSLLGMCLYECIRRLGGSFAVAGIASAAVLFLYGIMTGFGVSSVRAFLMFGISMGAAITGKGYDLPSALGASVLYLLYRNPYVLFQTGFLLSVGAILGIIVVLPVLNLIFVPNENVRFQSVRQGIRSGIAIQLATFPVLLSSFYEFSPYSILLNCIVIPLLTVVILGAVTAVLISVLLPPLAGLLLMPSLWILDLYEVLCRLAGKLPGSSVITGKPEPYRVFGYYLLLIVIAGAAYLFHHKRALQAGYEKTEKETYREQKQRKQIPKGQIHMRKQVFSMGNAGRPAGVVFFAILVYVLLVWREKSGMDICMLDVGQGQSIYIRCGSSDILYDGGSTDISQAGRYRIAPFLKASGVARLELVIVSHLDADHYNGIRELIEDELIQIDCLLLPGLEEPDESYQKLVRLAKQQGIKMQTVMTNDRLTMNETRFRVLHPSAGYRAGNKNDTSIVMEMEYKDVTMLLTGDVEKEGEMNMIKAGILADVDILQLAHHGSDSSSTEEFLDIIQPQIALISCGKDNRYGHPSPEVLQRLDERGICYYVTMKEGCIHIALP